MRKQYRLKSEVSVSNSTSINFVTKPTNEPCGIRSEFPELKGRRCFVKNFDAKNDTYIVFQVQRFQWLCYVIARNNIQCRNLCQLFNEANCNIVEIYSDIINNTSNINITMQNCIFKWSTKYIEKYKHISLLISCILN